MSDEPISNLPVITVPASLDLFVMVQAGVTSQLDYSDLLSALTGEYLALAGGTMSGDIELNYNSLLFGSNGIITASSGDLILNTIVDLQFISEDTSPFFRFKGIGSDNGDGIFLCFESKDTANDDIAVSGFASTIVDNTLGAEEGDLRFTVVTSGTEDTNVLGMNVNAEKEVFIYDNVRFNNLSTGNDPILTSNAATQQLTLTGDLSLTLLNGVAIANYALTTGNLSQFAATTSSQLAGVISDETGTGSLVFATSPTIVTPTIASFINAGHNHEDAAGGATLTATDALNATGTTNSTTFLRGDNTWAIPSDGDGEANTSSNSGTGEGIALSKDGINLPFKSLKAGTNITLTPSTNEIEISSQSSGSGAILTEKYESSNIPNNQYGTFNSVGLFSSTEENAQIPMPRAGTIKNFTVNVVDNTTTGTSFEMIIRINGVSTIVKVVFPLSPIIGSFTDTVNSIAVSQGDLVSVIFSKLGSGNLRINGMSIEVT